MYTLAPWLLTLYLTLTARFLKVPKNVGSEHA